MGMPLFRKVDQSRDSDQTAARRSNIRRRRHHRRLSDAYHRYSSLDRDRRSSQQVLLDLLQLTQDNHNSSSSNISSTAATSNPASSLPPPSIVQPPRRDSPALPALSRYEEGDMSSFFSNGPREGYGPLPAFLASAGAAVRVIRQSEPLVPPPRDREREREAVPSLRPRFDFGPFRMGPYPRHDEISGYERESSPLRHMDNERPSGLLEAVNRARDIARDQTRGFPVPDVGSAGAPGRRRGSVVDGLGDRERSLSPDQAPWDLFFGLDGFPNNDIGPHCDFGSDDSDEEEHVEPAPNSRRWGEIPAVGSPAARALSRRLLGLRNDIWSGRGIDTSNLPNTSD